jgi:hypothetical protein
MGSRWSRTGFRVGCGMGGSPGRGGWGSGACGRNAVGGGLGVRSRVASTAASGPGGPPGRLAGAEGSEASSLRRSSRRAAAAGGVRKLVGRSAEAAMPSACWFAAAAGSAGVAGPGGAAGAVGGPGGVASAGRRSRSWRPTGSAPNQLWGGAGGGGSRPGSRSVGRGVWSRAGRPGMGGPGPVPVSCPRPTGGGSSDTVAGSPDTVAGSPDVVGAICGPAPAWSGVARSPGRPPTASAAPEPASSSPPRPSSPFGPEPRPGPASTAGPGPASGSAPGPGPASATGPGPASTTERGPPSPSRPGSRLVPELGAPAGTAAAGACRSAPPGGPSGSGPRPLPRSSAWSATASRSGPALLSRAGSGAGRSPSGTGGSESGPVWSRPDVTGGASGARCPGPGIGGAWGMGRDGGTSARGCSSPGAGGVVGEASAARWSTGWPSGGADGPGSSGPGSGDTSAAGGSAGSGESGSRRPGRGVGSFVWSTQAPSCGPPDGRCGQPIEAGTLPRQAVPTWECAIPPAAAER